MWEPQDRHLEALESRIVQLKTANGCEPRSVLWCIQNGAVEEREAGRLVRRIEVAAAPAKASRDRGSVRHRERALGSVREGDVHQRCVPSPISETTRSPPPMRLWRMPLTVLTTSLVAPLAAFGKRLAALAAPGGCMNCGSQEPSAVAEPARSSDRRSARLPIGG